MAPEPPLQEALPLLNPGADLEPYELAAPVQVTVKTEPGQAGRPQFCHMLLVLLFLAAIGLHTRTIYVSLDGWAGLTSPNPILKDDHPLYLHSAVITKTFLEQSLTTAGYDPAFMGGYAKSAVFPASSTLPEAVIAATPSSIAPEVAYKFYVLLAATLGPLLVAWAAAGLWGSRHLGMATAITYLIYIWTDFPSQYISFGMIPYFLSIPIALLTLSFCCKWLDSNGLRHWAAMTALLSLAVFVHFTSLMVLGPAAFVAWAVSQSKIKHALGGFFAFILAALANAFWWWPGVVMAATKDDSGFAFSHSAEGFLARLAKIPWNEAPVQPFLWLGLLAGFPLAFKVRNNPAAGLAGFALGGFFWGYGAGAFPQLDFLQPGRHTYAFYLAASAFLARFGSTLLEMLNRVNRSARLGTIIGISLICVRIFGPTIAAVTRTWTAPTTAPLSSTVPPMYTAIFNALKPQVAFGERVLYEEGGMGGDIFEGRRYSGVMARALGAEFIGGPYLHAALNTNVVQFGEGKLCGRADWDLAWLEQMRLRYGLGLIVAWSDRPRTLIDANPDRFQVILNQGPLRIARLLPQTPADTIVTPRQALAGQEFVDGDIVAETGRIRLRLKPNAIKTGVDRKVVLRYHWVPNLRVTGVRDVRIESESAKESTLPPLISLVLGPDAEGDAAIQLNPLGN